MIRVSHIECVHTFLIGGVQSLLKGGTVIKTLWQQYLASWLKAPRSMWKPYDFAPQALVSGMIVMVSGI